MAGCGHMRSLREAESTPKLHRLERSDPFSGRPFCATRRSIRHGFAELPSPEVVALYMIVALTAPYRRVMSVHAGVLFMGNEVLAGRVTDRNGPWVAQQLLTMVWTSPTSPYAVTGRWI